MHIRNRLDFWIGIFNSIPLTLEFRAMFQYLLAFAREFLQNLQGFLFAAITIFTTGSYTGGTAIRAETIADEFERPGDKLVVQFKEFLAEPDPRGDQIVQHNRRLAEVLIFNRFDVRAQVTRIAHQK